MNYDGTLSIQIKDHGELCVEGVRMSNVAVKMVLTNPPEGLFSVRRDGDMLVIQTFDTAEKAAKYFDPK